MVLKVVEKWVSGKIQEVKVSQCIENKMLVRFVCKGESTGLFNCYALITYQKSRWPQKYRNDRHGVNITVLIPMRDFTKLKRLEVSAISWRYFGWSLAYLQRCEFFFFFFL